MNGIGDMNGAQLPHTLYAWSAGKKPYPMTTLALDKRVVLTLLLAAQFAVRKLHGSF